jgi:beta-lactamase superfamily II metal-dependent hydrolase
MAAIMFAAYPAPFIRETPKANGAKKQQLLWGDFVRHQGEEAGEWVKVRGRNEIGWMHRDDLQQERLLEINFVDIGQGDGAFLVTPDDEFLLIDAGAGANMHRFLSWRFNLRTNPQRTIAIKAAVISHSDQDHYLGFRDLFRSAQFTFDAIYHNGLVERAGADLLGPVVFANGRAYVTDLIDDLATLRARLDDAAFVGSKQYPRMLKAALASGRVANVHALDAGDGFLPGYGAERELSIQVLAPVRESVNGASGLRSFKRNDGMTKNGHSVVLKLTYRNRTVLLGGDLNVPAERYLLQHYTGIDPETPDEAARAALLASARSVFNVDVAKACHHGSADFTDLFLQAVNPVATVISSGDSEPHAHPRPDTIGAIGKHGRGPRPLIFSTELSRSANETITSPTQTFATLQRLFAELQAAATADERRIIQRQIDPLIERSIAVYGMINVRTDGEKILIAYKLERPGSGHREFDIHLLAPDASGDLAYVSEH